MNYCEKIHYTILNTEPAEFAVMVDDLLSQLPQNEVIMRLAFFGTPGTNEEYVARRVLLREKIRRYYGDCEPALSYVSQPPLNAPLLMEVHSYVPDAQDRITFRHYQGVPYVLLENASGRFLFAGGFQGDVLHFGIEPQSVEAFRLLGDVLRREGFPLNSIIRQWNYIERITAFDGQDQHYQAFNNARSDFYSKTEWTNGYPAATGIGANLGGILIDVDAVVFTTPDAFATPIDNKLQVAAHAYSEQVLEVARQKKTTPKFERAKSMSFQDRKLIYISGTAAIRGEESLKGVGLERQLRITMENIAELIADAKLVKLRVYLKNKSDYEEAERLMNTYGLNIPISYMWADVCRDELLIGIEEACDKATIIMCLLSDAAVMSVWPTMKPYLTAGKALYFSHGFAITWNDRTGVVPPADIDVIMVAPKGSGTSLRSMFLEGRGLNSSFAIYQDATGKAMDRTLALGIGIGSGYLFETTFIREATSDLTGERGSLMGAIQGLLLAQYEVLRENGHTPSEAFNETVEELTQSLMPLFAKNGMDWMYANCSTTAQRGALDWMGPFHDAIKPVVEKLYANVKCGNEAQISIDSNSKPDYREKLEAELKALRESEMWQTAVTVRKLRPENN